MDASLAKAIIAQRPAKGFTRWVQIENAVGAPKVEEMQSDAYKPLL